MNLHTCYALHTVFYALHPMNSMSYILCPTFYILCPMGYLPSINSLHYLIMSSKSPTTHPTHWLKLQSHTVRIYFLSYILLLPRIICYRLELLVRNTLIADRFLVCILRQCLGQIYQQVITGGERTSDMRKDQKCQ
jgi:hypothetical protein